MVIVLLRFCKTVTLCVSYGTLQTIGAAEHSAPRAEAHRNLSSHTGVISERPSAVRLYVSHTDRRNPQRMPPAQPPASRVTPHLLSVHCSDSYSLAPTRYWAQRPTTCPAPGAPRRGSSVTSRALQPYSVIRKADDEVAPAPSRDALQLTHTLERVVQCPKL